MTTQLPDWDDGERLFSFDPGDTTGFCAVRRDRRWTGGFTVERSAEIPFSDIIPRAKHLLFHGRPKVCVIEEFTLRKDGAEGMIGSHVRSAEVTGVIRTWCAEFNIPVVLQQPIMMARVEILHDHYPILISPSTHGGDSYKHARYYFIMRLGVY